MLNPSLASNAYAGCANAIGSTSPREIGALDATASSIENGLHELTCCIDALESRANAVLRPAVPTPGAAGQSLKEVPHCSPAVHHLQTQRQRIEALINRVNDIASRLDT